jgi:hypothetical protein
LAKAADPQKLALQALAQALVGPGSKVLHGSKGKPCFFVGAAAAMKQAAQFCQEKGWLEPTGEFEGTGKTRKELFRITQAGIQETLANSEPVLLLQGALANLQQIAGLKEKVDQTLDSLKKQEGLIRTLLDRFTPPDFKALLANVANPAQATSAPTFPAQNVLDYLADYQRRNPYGHCPLPELFHRVAEPVGLTIGQFHDGLRWLVQGKRILLHPFTGAAYQLEDEQYALVAGQEIKYYAERVAGA